MEPSHLVSLDLVERPWASYAACRDADPDIFFAANDSAAEEALRICGGCAVKAECLDWALEMGARYGVWGGMTEGQRRKAARQRAKVEG